MIQFYFCVIRAGSVQGCTDTPISQQVSSIKPISNQQAALNWFVQCEEGLHWLLHLIKSQINIISPVEINP